MDSHERRETELLVLMSEFEMILEGAKITEPVNEDRLLGLPDEDQELLRFGLASSQLTKVSNIIEQILNKAGAENGGSLINQVLARFSGKINKSLEEGIVEAAVSLKSVAKKRTARLN